MGSYMSGPSPVSPPSDLPAPPDPYDAAPSWFSRHASYLHAAAVFILTVVLTVFAFPPSRTPEFAYAFAVPAIFWAYLRPSFRLFAATTLGAQAVAWTIIFGWLHNVTWGGLFLLGPFIGVWIGLWFIGVWWVMPRILGKPTSQRLLAVAGLAALWVVLEWSRTWLLGGFPWMPLAATQWQRVAILQITAYTGAGGVSFVLIGMNLGFAAYAHRLVREREKTGFNRRSQEFLAALFLLLVCVATQISETLNSRLYSVALGKFAFVQPYIPQAVKWDPAEGPAIMATLETVTRAAAATRPDVILWPEATTPWALKGDTRTRDWIEGLTREIGVPLVLGSIAIEPSTKTPGEEDWFNAVFAVDPVIGVQSTYYAKRQLVPFGEFVPLRPLLGWIGKFVPIGDDFGSGVDPSPLVVPVAGRPLALGALICYEDIFPQLARQSVLAGADVLMVNTNNGWFGEGGAAYQHASNSVLRAVETRRPVLRCGNGGWSGWIDEFGATRAVLTQNAAGTIRATVDEREPGTIYFRGTQTVTVTADARWVGKSSFYVEHGDWFVLVCGVAALLAAVTIRGKKLA
jgi:apolipoprotein N-acyltransferase